ncbi:MAG: LysR family transcriptional regulator [Rhizomicrobium sp.]|nr:LysR family transcriptional regulator [Rhizomicrobium sp.]
MDIDIAHIRKLDMTLLLVFQEVLRHRKTTVASANLGLSQSAVSHALTRLRGIFGDPLFLRRRDGLQPTARALALGPQIGRLITLALEAVRAAREFEPQRSERLFRIAANDLFSTLAAPPLLARLQNDAPNVRIAFRFAVGMQAFEGLRNDDFDLALGRFYRLPDGFENAVLGEENFVVIARQGHPIVGKRLTLKRFLSCDHVLVSFAGGLKGTVDEALSVLGLKRRVCVSMPVFFSAFTTVAASDLIATVPARLAARHARAFGLAIHPTPFSVDPFPMSLVRHGRSKGDAGLDWLASQIATCLA